MRKSHSANPKLNAALNALAHPSLPIIDLSLGRTLALLKALGNPHLKLPPVIHVAGTNGKGSLIAYLRAILEKAGLCVHQYTSPYLVSFNEQIVVSGKEISDDYLLEIIDRITPRLNDHSVTFFEATTIAAFMAFAENPAAVVLLETGLGGRLDATNVIPKPALCAITPIDMDHQEFLGDSIAKIAAEKAGIMKEGVACVIAKQSPDALAVFERTVKEKSLPLHAFGKDWIITLEKTGFMYQSKRYSLSLPLPNLNGEHQIYNAANAVACIDKLKLFSIVEEDIKYGVTHANWPARLQRLTKGKLQSILPKNVELWLDGGHNPSAARELARWAQSHNDAPLFVICGMLKNKEALEFFDKIAPFTKSLVAVPIEGEILSRSPSELANLASCAGIESFESESVEKAIERIAKRSSTLSIPYRILVCGSLYLAGNILRDNS